MPRSRARRWSTWPVGVALLLGGCSGGDSSAPLTTNVEVCVDPGTATPAVVEVRQDGEVVGTVVLGSAGGGSAGIQAPPGPVEAYVNDELVGSGEVSEGNSVSFSCRTSTATATSTAAPELEPTPEPTPEVTHEPTSNPTTTPSSTSD